MELMNMKTTDNGRFGTMAAVIPQTILCKLARYYPAASSVEAATSPSRFDVVRKRWRQCIRTKENIKWKIQNKQLIINK